MSSAFPLPRSVYSHGGGSVDGNPAVPGTSPSTGRTISTYGCIACPAMHIILKYGTGAAVILEANNGQVDQQSDPPVDEWVDYSNGGFILNAANPVARPTLTLAIPYWRTRIVSIDPNSEVVSSVSSIRTIGQVVSPNYPIRRTAIQVT